MKLRIKGNSIRLRLTRSEVALFGEKGEVVESLRFVNGRSLTYALEASGAVGRLSARFEDDVITLVMPAAWVPSWLGTSRVGFEGAEELDSGGVVKLAVEKDFQCLNTRPDEEDAFPHPLADDAGAVSNL